jgi:tRNA dimethylallyltransferase
MTTAEHPGRISREAEEGVASLPALALVGPTASGKSALGLQLARQLDGEIISLDSRQLYRGMDIGTAKPSLPDRASVLHHGLDLVDPGERFSAGRFAREARDWIRDIRARGRLPILVGGTGFFLRALLQPIFREPPLDPHRRKRLEGVLDRMGADEALRWVRVLDPERAELAGEGGIQRIRRALEVPLLTGRSLTWWHTHAPAEGDPVAMQVVLLEAESGWLESRIRLRVQGMMEAGLVGEVERLLAAGFDENTPGMTGTGYREAITAATRQYARRQRTWFRHQLPPDTIRLDASVDPDLLIRETVAAWKGREGEA